MQHNANHLQNVTSFTCNVLVLLGTSRISSVRYVGVGLSNVLSHFWWFILLLYWFKITFLLKILGITRGEFDYHQYEPPK